MKMNQSSANLVQMTPWPTVIHKDEFSASKGIFYCCMSVTLFLPDCALI